MINIMTPKLAPCRIKPEGNCLNILDIGEVFAYTILNFFGNLCVDKVPCYHQLCTCYTFLNENLLEPNSRHMLLGTSEKSNCGSLLRRCQVLMNILIRFYRLSVSSLSITTDNNAPYLHVNNQKTWDSVGKTSLLSRMSKQSPSDSIHSCPTLPVLFIVSHIL